MYQRDEGSWRKRNEALKGKVLQDVGGLFFCFFFWWSETHFLSLLCQALHVFSPLWKTKGKKPPKVARCYRYSCYLLYKIVNKISTQTILENRNYEQIIHFQEVSFSLFQTEYGSSVWRDSTCIWWLPNWKPWGKNGQYDQMYLHKRENTTVFQANLIKKYLCIDRVEEPRAPL